MRRRVIGVVALVMLTPVVVVVGEVQLARMGPDPEPVPAGVDGCFGCDGPTPERVVWLGDSTAAGVGASTAQGVLGPQVARLIGRPTRIVDLAESGATVEDVLRDQLPRLPALGALDVVAVSVGANDVTHLTRTRTFQRRYRQLLERLPSEVKVVVLGLPDMGSPPRLAQPLRSIAGFRARQLDRIVRDEAKHHRVIHVDIAGATGPRFRSDHGLFAHDRYHPNDRGYAVWAEAVAARWPER